jgi:hypothetical protein
MVLRLSNTTWYYTSSITNVLRHHLTKNIKDSTIGAMTANFEMVEEYQKIIVKHQYGLKTTNITTKKKTKQQRLENINTPPSQNLYNLLGLWMSYT